LVPPLSLFWKKRAQKNKKEGGEESGSKRTESAGPA
jgi:hypothetical protein